MPDRLPLPVMGEILQSAGSGNQIFSMIDLKFAFWQIEFSDDSKEVIAFSVDSAYFEFNRIPFGLYNAPSTLQRLMNNLFSDKIGVEMFIYLDDLVIFSRDLPSHLALLREVLGRLLTAGLKVEISKCDFLKKRISFLGHVIDQIGVHASDDKIKAMRECPTPTCANHVNSFHGLCSFYRYFVKNLAKRAAPLTKFLLKNIPFTWGEAEENAFKDLKDALCSSPVLVFPNFKSLFLLTTDASQQGLGFVLEQEDENGVRHVVAYDSRAISDTESRYSVIHL